MKQHMHRTSQPGGNPDCDQSWNLEHLEERKKKKEAPLSTQNKKVENN